MAFAAMRSGWPEAGHREHGSGAHGVAAEAGEFHRGTPMPQPMKAILVTTTSAMPAPNSASHMAVRRQDLPASSQTTIATPIGPVTARLPITLNQCHHIIIYRSPVFCTAARIKTHGCVLWRTITAKKYFHAKNTRKIQLD
jgi:hypothetical protein